MKRCRIVLAAVLLLPATAGAHDLGADCRLVGGRVEVQAYFPDDEPAVDARVRVTDEGGRVVAEGRTDEKGVWRFDHPADGRYTVRVDAGGGHLKQVTLAVGEVVASEGPSRGEFTRFPVGRLVVGVAVIGALAVAFVLARRHKP